MFSLSRFHTEVYFFYFVTRQNSSVWLVKKYAYFFPVEFRKSWNISFIFVPFLPIENFANAVMREIDVFCLSWKNFRSVESFPAWKWALTVFKATSKQIWNSNKKSLSRKLCLQHWRWWSFSLEGARSMTFQNLLKIDYCRQN